VNIIRLTCFPGKEKHKLFKQTLRSNIRMTFAIPLKKIIYNKNKSLIIIFSKSLFRAIFQLWANY
jgi:hypothetical protein